MSFFVTSLRVNFKRFFLQKTLWFTFIGLIMALTVGGIFFNRTETPFITVVAGVYYDNNCAVQVKIAGILVNGQEELVNFIVYSDKNLLIEDVRLGRIECGYVLSSELRVRVINSAFSTVVPILNEIVAAAVFQAFTEEIVTDWLKDFFGYDNIQEFVAWHFEYYRQADIFMTPDFEGGGFGAEQQISLVDITASRAVHGLIGLAMLIVIMFYMPENKAGFNNALRSCKKLGIYNFSTFVSVFIVIFMMGLVGVFVMHGLVPVLVGNFSVIYLFIYCFAIIVPVKLFSGFVQSFGLFIIILHVFFGGVFIDLFEINPILGRLQYVFPLYWYLSATAL